LNTRVTVMSKPGTPDCRVQLPVSTFSMTAGGRGLRRSLLTDSMS
jgi:hypothetical protein